MWLCRRSFAEMTRTINPVTAFPLLRVPRYGCLGLSRGLRDPKRTICPAVTGKNTLDEAVLTACRHSMNEMLHLQEKMHCKHCARITAHCNTRACDTDPRIHPHAPLKAPQGELRGYLTSPHPRHPLRVGSRPSGRPHDERPPLHGDRTPPLTPSRLRALRRAHARPPEPLPASSGPSWPPAARGGVARRQLPREAQRGGGSRGGG